MGWLRKQPVAERKHGNPESTLANKVEDARIFLKEFGVTKLLKTSMTPPLNGARPARGPSNSTRECCDRAPVVY